MVEGSTNRFPRGNDLRRHITRARVNIKDDRRNGTFEGDHFEFSHGTVISRKQREVACVKPLLPRSCWRVVNARSGFRRVRVGEASCPRPFVASVAQETKSKCPD